MTEQALYRVQIDTRLQHVCGETVTQCVNAAVVTVKAQVAKASKDLPTTAGYSSEAIAGQAEAAVALGNWPMFLRALIQRGAFFCADIAS